MITIKCQGCEELVDVNAGGICFNCGAFLPAVVYGEAKQAETAYGEVSAALAALGNSKTVDITFISAAEHLYQKGSELIQKLVKYQSFYQDNFNRLNSETAALYSNIQEAKKKEVFCLQEEIRQQQRIGELWQQKEDAQRQQGVEKQRQQQDKVRRRANAKTAIGIILPILFGLIIIGVCIGIMYNLLNNGSSAGTLFIVLFLFVVIFGTVGGIIGAFGKNTGGGIGYGIVGGIIGGIVGGITGCIVNSSRSGSDEAGIITGCIIAFVGVIIGGIVAVSK